MSKTWLAVISAIALVTVSVVLARAGDISAKKLSIKDDPVATKDAVQVQSADVGVQYSHDDNPATNGASVHVYSATDDMCVLLGAGTDWKDSGTTWKYKNKVTKNSARISNGKLSVKIKSGVTYTLDEMTQGTVNAQVQFGTGTRYCLRCPGNKKDQPGKFLGQACVAAPCAAEPSSCDPPIPTTTSTTATTTSSTTTSSTTTTTCPAPTPPSIKGSLTATPGRFNYNLMIGLPAANAACNTNFLCTHACTYSELQTAATAGELVGLMDTSSMTVTSFWAIDSSRPPLDQCQDDVVSFKNWEYATAHTASRGDWVALNNGLGTLGALQSGQQCNFVTRWVGCCQ